MTQKIGGHIFLG